MVTSPYFKNFNSGRQQFLVESLILESIKKYGYDMKYIPRKIGNIDKIFGEDTISSFEHAATIEMYIKNTDGYKGDGRFLSKFGIESRDTLTLCVSSLRFQQAKTPKLMDERGFTIQLEDRPIYSPGQSFAVVMDSDDNDLYSIDSDKPLEGDLIFFPLVNKIFEITYVNFETIFYQTGKLQVYDLECEMFEYSNEDFETPEININDLLNGFSTDVRDTSLLTENQEHFLLEDSSRLILESYDINAAVPSAINDEFTEEANDVVDFSEKSPLVVGNKFGKW